MSHDSTPVVRFKCTSPACKRQAEAELGDLSLDGCPRCGCKRLEVWHPSRGHVLIDFRSQKSVRKRRRRELAARIGSWVLLAVLIGCSPAPDNSLPRESATVTSAARRAAPAVVTWTWESYDSVCGERIIRGRHVEPVFIFDVREITRAPVTRFALENIEDLDVHQIFRLEWSPRADGDTCYYPIAFGVVEAQRGPGLLDFAIEGLVAATDSTPGDQIFIWRSCPWPGYEATPDSYFCMTPVYQGAGP